LLALATAKGGAQQPPQAPEDPLARILFPPELVMQHQQDIGLRPEQRAAITKAIQDFQSKAVDLQWRMQEQPQRRATLVDQAGAPALVAGPAGVEPMKTAPVCPALTFVSVAVQPSPVSVIVGMGFPADTV